MSCPHKNILDTMKFGMASRKSGTARIVMPFGVAELANGVARFY